MSIEANILRVIWFIEDYWEIIVGSIISLIVLPIVFYCVVWAYEYLERPKSKRKKSTVG